MKPIISVVIPAFNRADYLAQTVESVLAQSFANYEIIVVDDGSTDDTKAVLEQFKAYRQFRYIYQENQGRSSARNNGFVQSSGSFLLFLDSDDVLAPSCLEALHAQALISPRAGVIAGLIEFIDENGRQIPYVDEFGATALQTLGRANVIGSMFRTFLSPAVYYWQISPEAKNKLPAFAYPTLLDGEHLCMGSALVRRQCLWVGELFDGELEPCEDSDFWLRLTMRYELECVESVVTRYRRHGSNTPNSHFYRAVVKLYRKHLGLIETCGNLPRNLRCRLRARCFTNLGDRYYALGFWMRPLLCYARAMLCSPSVMSDHSLWSRIGKSFLPPFLRDGLRRMVRVDSTRVRMTEKSLS